jgi:hypothetical protein
VLRVQSDGRGISRTMKGKDGETRPSMKTDAESQVYFVQSVEIRVSIFSVVMPIYIF